VLLQLRLNLWSRDFFNAVDARDAASVLRNVVVFVALGIGLMAAAAWQIDLKMAVQGEWRRALAHALIDRWLDRATHYHLRFFGGDYDNPDQRLADDTFLVTQSAVDFATGILVSVLLLFGFLGVLWTLSGTLRFALGGIDIALPGYLVFAAIVYAVIGTIFAHYVGGPLTAINERRRTVEGDLRAALLRIRDNSESIALLRGEATERDHPAPRARPRARCMAGAAPAHAQLTWATSAYTIAAPVFPLLIAAPQYLAGELSLGGLMQVSWAFVQIQRRWAGSSTTMRGCRTGAPAPTACSRSTDAAAVIARPPEEGEPRIRYFGNAEGVLRLIDLQVATQDGTIMIDRATVEIRPGEKVLIVGESGIGKSMLIRAIAGLWPWGKGTIEWPAGAATMFVPQRDYMPVGSLRAVLAYPMRPENVDDAVLTAALARCGARKPRGSAGRRRALGGRAVEPGARAPRLRKAGGAPAALDLPRRGDVASRRRGGRLDHAHLQRGACRRDVITIEHRPGLEAYHDRTLTLVRAADTVELTRYRGDAGGDGAPSFWRRLVARAREARGAPPGRR
jgi:putative ATP-binding cassette transporter